MSASDLRVAARAMRDAHGPNHERHAMWGAMADLLDIIEAGYEEYVPEDRGETQMQIVSAWADNVAAAYMRATPPNHPRPELGGGDETTDDETKERA